MAAFGAHVEQQGPGEWTVHGVGTGGFAEPEDVIDCGNAGTGVRLIMGAMATTPITATFTGDASLRSRPMGRITEPLSHFGARAYGRAKGRLPLTIVGASDPMPVRYTSPHASAQIKSAVLLAGFSLLSAVLFHANFGDQLQTIMFMKNLALTGAFLMLFVHGAGPFSVDERGRG